jgi:hypothetical protein
MPPINDRIAQDVTDISSDVQLLRYATAGQLEQLLRRRRGLTQEKIAQGAGFSTNSRSAGAILSHALKDRLNAKQLKGLDEIIGALAPPDLDGTGGLSSLSLRLSAERREKIKDSSLTAHVPPSWTRKILQDPPADEVGVLIQASALLAAFLATDKMDTGGTSVESIRDRYSEEMTLLVRRLILISVAPPTSRNYDAQILLGMLASYAFEPMRERLEAELRYSPLGYRVWRAITKLVTLSENDEHYEPLRVWVRRLVLDSDELRKRSLYAGRSLDLELAITVPAKWSPPGDDWVGRTLRERAWNPAATVRERGTAAMGLWQRAIGGDRSGLAEAREDLSRLITELRKPESRPDAAAGLRWIAATLEHVIRHEVAICNDWPDVDEPWFRHVQEAADELDNSGIPAHLRAGTKCLFRHMILQNAAAYRAQAIETVVTSGWTEPVARALGLLLRKERDESWLRIRVEAALGSLQRPDRGVGVDLTDACLQAYKKLKVDGIPHDGRPLEKVREDERPARSLVTELHTSLFAVGDCFGVAGAEDRARTAREKLRPVLTALADGKMPRARILRRAARAAAYLLTVTAQPRDGGENDLSQVLLEQLSDHPDPPTASLSQWALKVRFAPDGRVLPLLAAAEHGELYDTP